MYCFTKIWTSLPNIDFTRYVAIIKGKRERRLVSYQEILPVDVVNKHILVFSDFEVQTVDTKNIRASQHKM